jgi:hypothetical protein
MRVLILASESGSDAAGECALCADEAPLIVMTATCVECGPKTWNVCSACLELAIEAVLAEGAIYCTEATPDHEVIEIRTHRSS